MSTGEDYVLGRDVTELFRGKESRATVVVSVRLSAEEFSTVSQAAEQEGKSVSQVVRDAIAQRQMRTMKIIEPCWIATSFESGSSFFFGEGRPSPTVAFGSFLYEEAAAPASAAS